MKNKILSVRIEHKYDESPDTSFLGEFTDNPEPQAIIRYGEHSGKTVSQLSEDEELPSKSREYRFFVPCVENYAGCTESEILQYSVQDWQRIEALNNGQWCFIGIIAKCEFQLGSDLVQTFRSGGLWGIESDSDKEYLEQVAKEQLEELRGELVKIGFSNRAITRAFKNVKTQNI